jgi:crotonobetainyl-CoA:carnitine CoA-transferase CaiB-like acyl-CoA transferase
MNRTILSNIRILDITRVLAGPFYTRILADFGAEVIKIQSGKISTGVETNNTPYFNAWNRNKRSITLDLDHPEGKNLFLRLVRRSDVIVENFSPRVMPNLGLAYNRLKEAKDDIIMLSMSGLGQTGPWKDFVAFAPIIQSLGAMTYLTSFSENAPMGPGFSYADLVSGLYGALGILAALEHRDQTGEGQYIDLSELESMCSVIGPTLLDVFVHQKDILPLGNESDCPPAAPHGCYPCNEEGRRCVISVFNDSEWKVLCEVLNNPEWTRDPRFMSLSSRKTHKQALDIFIGDWTKKYTAEDVAARLQGAGVCAGIVQNAEDLAHDPQLIHRGFFKEMNHPVSGRTYTDTFPVLFKSEINGPWKPAPLLGEDNVYVFKELLGLADQEVDSLKEKGIIG